jgi:hypothetical protein
VQTFFTNQINMFSDKTKLKHVSSLVQVVGMGLADALSMITFALSIIYKKKATRNRACHAGVTSPPALGATADMSGHSLNRVGTTQRYVVTCTLSLHGTLSIAFQVRVCYPCLDFYRFFAPCPYP